MTSYGFKESLYASMKKQKTKKTGLTCYILEVLVGGFFLALG